MSAHHSAGKKNPKEKISEKTENLVINFFSTGAKGRIGVLYRQKETANHFCENSYIQNDIYKVRAHRIEKCDDQTG